MTITEAIAIVASTLAAEGMGVSIYEKTHISDTIYNRAVLSGRPPAEIVLRKGQFACWKDRKDPRKRIKTWELRDPKEWADCLALAEKIVLQYESLERKPAGKITHFYSPHRGFPPKWAHKLKGKLKTEHFVFGHLGP